MEKLSISKLLVLYDELSSSLASIDNCELKTLKKRLENNCFKNGEFKELFPSLSNKELNNLLLLFKIDRDKNRVRNNDVEFVGTFPSNIDSNLRKTISVVRQIILESEKSILITGYSISEFINEILDLLILKSQNGISVRFFIDKGINIENFFDKKIKNEKFKLYKYKMNDSYSSLHAKVIVVDNKKAFVSSSNLSYNGIVNNIEIGTLVTGEKVTSITNLFEKLIKKEMFNELT